MWHILIYCFSPRPKKVLMLPVTQRCPFLGAFAKILLGSSTIFLFNKFIYYLKVNFCAVPLTNNVNNSTFEVQCQMKTPITLVRPMHKK